MYRIQSNFMNDYLQAEECLQCGERLYAPETVEKIQNAIWQNRKVVTGD